LKVKTISDETQALGHATDDALTGSLPFDTTIKQKKHRGAEATYNNKKPGL